MDIYQAIIARGRELGYTFKPHTQKERLEIQADNYNRSLGDMNEVDGIECSACHNKGMIANVVSKERDEGTEPLYDLVFSDCRCMSKRNSMRRLKSSGLEASIRSYTFDKFNADDTWQQTLKNAAMEYAKAPEGWFFAGGQSGCGKTHICTAICRQLILDNRDVQYMRWRDEAVSLKAYVNDPEEYARRINKFKTVDVLYIDDLFKTGKAPSGEVQKPTGADINLAFEIINYRYVNPKLITIISSECGISEIINIDEAVGGRIAERAGNNCFSIAPDKSRNYRLSKARNI